VKTDLLGAVAVWGTLAEIVTWLAIASALLLTGFAAWLVIAVARRIAASFAPANQLVAEIAAHPDTPELDAGHARLDTAIREEKQS
jgi:ABC-type nickel/cobalt efflux system permease component RcnA